MATGTVYDPEEKIWSGPEYALGDQSISFGQMLLDRLKVHGNKLMQINHDSGYQMSAREMRLKSLRIAASLTALGIGPGDIVQIVVSEHDDLVPLWLGIIAAGAGMNALHVSFSERKLPIIYLKFNLYFTKKYLIVDKLIVLNSISRRSV